MVTRDELGTLIFENTVFYANDVFIQLRGNEAIIDFHRFSPRYNPDTRQSLKIREHATIIVSMEVLFRLADLTADISKKSEEFRKTSPSNQKIFKEENEKNDDGKAPHYVG